jgi:hypothetical protein
MSVKSQQIANTSGTDDPASIQVVYQLADAQGLDPKDLPPLTRTIDLEALDNFIDSAPSDATVSFSVDGFNITVLGDGTVRLDSSPDS